MSSNCVAGRALMVRRQQQTVVTGQELTPRGFYKGGTNKQVLQQRRQNQRASSSVQISCRATRPSVSVVTGVVEREEVVVEENEAASYFEPENGSLLIGELLQGDLLTDTIEHRAICATAALLAFGLFCDGLANGASVPSTAVSVIGGYYAADLVSGIFHWGVDNYGSDKTPLLGNVIAAFQGHHLYPWTITKRETCNNLHKVAKPTIPALALFWALPLAPSMSIFLSTTTVLLVLSQQFHSWSHSRKSTLSSTVSFLQDNRILLSRRDHGQHHRNPFKNNYCIVSGVWNDLLDDNEFFFFMEKIVHEKTGIEPRCWHEDPTPEWLTGTTD